MDIHENYLASKLAASGQITLRPCKLGGFMCSTSGTVTLRNGNDSGTIVVATFPVTAGVWHACPLYFGSGCYADLASGATGTFGYSV